jgi:hypothetical protein
MGNRFLNPLDLNISLDLSGINGKFSKSPGLDFAAGALSETFVSLAPCSFESLFLWSVKLALGKLSSTYWLLLGLHHLM